MQHDGFNDANLSLVLCPSVAQYTPLRKRDIVFLFLDLDSLHIIFRLVMESVAQFPLNFHSLDESGIKKNIAKSGC